MNNFIVITLSLLLSIVLTITTFPLGYFAPDWIHLFLIYWILATPGSIGLFTVWIIGLLVDVVLGSTLGVNALVYSLVAYLIFKSYMAIRYLTVLQQGILILLLLLVKSTLILWIDDMLGISNYTTSLYWTPLISALAWPLVYYFLRSLRRKYNVT